MKETNHNMKVLLCDPMLATGGSACKALDVLCEQYGCDASKIIFANMICCPEGLQRLAKDLEVGGDENVLQAVSAVFPGYGG